MLEPGQFIIKVDGNDMPEAVPDTDMVQAGGVDPIILDLGDNGIYLTTAFGGVTFDLDADGVAEIKEELLNALRMNRARSC